METDRTTLQNTLEGVYDLDGIDSNEIFVVQTVQGNSQLQYILTR